MQTITVPSPTTIEATGRAFITGIDGRHPLAPYSGLRSALKKVAVDKAGEKALNLDETAPVPPQEVLAWTGPTLQATGAQTTQENERPGANFETKKANLKGIDVFMNGPFLSQVAHMTDD